MPRIISIDFGSKRTGIAVTDELQIIASALTAVDTADLIGFLQKYIATEKVSTALIGDPKQMNGKPSQIASEIEKFVSRFRSAFPDVDVVRADERFTSKLAFQSMIDSGIGKKKRQDKKTVDAIAATIMLQTYLSRKMI